MRFKPLLNELYTPGHGVTAIASDPIALGQFVSISGNGDEPNPEVGVAAEGTRAFGLAQDDANAGDMVGIQRGNTRCFYVPTTATITAGQDLQVGANGQPEPHSDGVVVAAAIHNSIAGHVALTLL